MTVRTMNKYRRHGGNVTTVKEIAHHRNGVCGEPFFVVRFTDTELDSEMVATVFPTYSESDDGTETYSANGRCAILSVARLSEGDIAFGSNSWRGDHWDSVLCQAITDQARAS